MAILKLKPSFQSYIWGGEKLKKEFHKDYDGPVLAESWELSCHPDGLSRIAEGEFEGKTLIEFIEWEGKRMLGKNCGAFSNFPVLIKFIDALDNLSIQVHPSDAYAISNEGQYGKTEMWYIAECEEDAYIYYGFKKQIGLEEFKKRILEHTLLEVLNKIPVKKGDSYFIDAGTLHAIGKGMVVAEIQQNSNVTYRVYDYGRKDKDGNERDLHIEKALKVTDRNPKVRSKTFPPHLGVCKYFTVDKLMLDGKYMNSVKGRVNADSFLHFLILEGSGSLRAETCTEFRKGDSILVTASTGEYEILGNCEALVTSIPYNSGLGKEEDAYE